MLIHPYTYNRIMRSHDIFCPDPAVRIYCHTQRENKIERMREKLIIYCCCHFVCNILTVCIACAWK